MPDPRALGADCDRCPLNGCRPVPSEEHPGALLDLVGPYPGPEEIVAGRVWIAGAGQELLRALRAAGLGRRDANWRNLLACNEPDGKIDRAITRARATGLRNPYDACAPRIRAETARAVNVVPLGAEAARFLIPGARGGILELRGGTVEIPAGWPSAGDPARKALPTVNPAFVVSGRSPRFKPFFYGDIARAVRFFRGSLNWAAPRVIYRPTPAALEAFLSRPSRFWPFDLETDAKEALIARIRCYGISDDRGDGVVVPLLSMDGRLEFYSSPDKARIVGILADFQRSRTHLKTGWNIGGYDIPCLLAHADPSPLLAAFHPDPTLRPLGTAFENWQDGILWHHAGPESELPHSLEFVASTRTDAPRWKRDERGRKISTGARNDQELWTYNSVDNKAVAMVMPSIVAETVAIGCAGLVEIEHRIQSVCRGMHRLGMPLDAHTDKPRYQWRKVGRVVVRAPLNAAAWNLKLTADAETHLIAARAALATNQTATEEARRACLAELALGGDAWGFDEGDGAEPDEEAAERVTLSPALAARGAFNPGSAIQLRRVLYDVCGLMPPAYLRKQEAFTPGGEFSTAEVVLLAFLAERGMDPVLRSLIDAVLRYRRAIKLLGTYVRPALRPFADGGIRWPDGRVRASWNCHVTTPGRRACSGPNLQNQPVYLRTMYRARGHRWLYGADKDQFHPRIFASRWRVARLLECFARGGDPHAESALACFGDEFRHASGWPATPGGRWTGAAKFLRQTGKILALAAAYGADTPTVHRVIVSTEDDAGNRPYAGWSHDKTALIHDNWRTSFPEFEAGWAGEIAAFRRDGFVREPVLNRRCYFRDGEDPNAIPNWIILASEAGIMAKDLLRVVEAIPFDGDGPDTGIVNDCHDSLTGETVDEATARRRAALVAECMSGVEPAYPDVRFTASGVCGPTWAEA